MGEALKKPEVLRIPSRDQKRVIARSALSETSKHKDQVLKAHQVIFKQYKDAYKELAKI